MKTWNYSLICVLLCVAGCFLPIPHKRVATVGQEGVIRDAITSEPVKGATVSVEYYYLERDGQNETMTVITKTVLTDTEGRFKVKDEKNWHAAFFLAFPMSYSELPFFCGAPKFPGKVTVAADGYDDWEWDWYRGRKEEKDVPFCIELSPKSNNAPALHCIEECKRERP